MIKEIKITYHLSLNKIITNSQHQKRIAINNKMIVITNQAHLKFKGIQL